MLGEFFLDMILIIGIISLFNVLRCLFKIRKVIKMNKDNPNIQGISIVNGEVKVIEKQVDIPSATEVEKELVEDPQCGMSLEKEKAYRVLKDGIEYFFCSWECREAFLAQYKKEEGC